MKKNLFTVLFLFLVAMVSAQTKTITGNVTSESDPGGVPGVSIVIKGTLNGTVTDVNGNYRISADDDKTLVFSFVGMKTQEVPVLGMEQVDVVLEPAVVGVDEVVIIGYGVQRKSDLTGAVSTIKADDIAKTALMDVANTIGGKVAGVQVTNNNGRPGSSPVIRIRGVGTLNNASPIFVVDGLIVSDIAFLNNSDIQSLDVLKDASATAIYGSRGANGVILITTKRGTKGESHIDFRSTFGVSQVENLIDMTNASEYATLRNLASQNAGEAELPFPNPGELGVGTNWWDELYQNAFSQDYQLSASGSSDKMSYHVSAGYQDQEGVIEKTDYQRLTLRANNEYFLTKSIKVGHNVSFIRTDKLNGPDATTSAYRTPAVFAPYDEDGNFNGSTEYNNPLVGTYYNNSKTQADKFIGNFYGEVKVSDFLFRSSYGFEKNDSYARAYNPEYYVSDTQYRDQSSLNKTYNRFRSYIWDNTLNFNKKFNDHSIDALAGISKQDTYAERLNGSAKDIPNNEDLWYLDATFDPESRVSENTASSWSYLSYLFRMNYTYKNKYLFTGTYRIDGSSKFSEDNRYAQFPSVALGWRVSEESFLKDSETLSNLKLRASWGQIGNDKIGAYATKQFLSTTETIGGNQSGIVGVFGPDETPHQGATATRLTDPNVKWETTTQLDLGVEMGFFDQKLAAEIDYYNRVTDDILIAIPIPSYMGIRVDPTVNAASVLNRGFEFMVRWTDTKGDFSYNVSANLSTLYNEVLALSDRRSWLTGAVQSQTITRTMTGAPIGSFWGYQTNGIFQNQEQINNSPTLGTEQPGDLIYVDNNGRDENGELTGQPDGIITNDDMTFIGSPIPDFVFGANVSMSYKAFDFSLDINGVSGNEINNLKAKKRWSYTYDYEKRFTQSWNGEGSTNVHPRVNNADVHNELENEYWLEDGSYLRIRNLQLGYTLPEDLIGKVYMKNVRAFVSVTNLHTFTKYSGFTPDVTRGGVLEAGIDTGVYPLSTTYSFGLNITF